MDPAPLPGGVEDPGGAGLEAFVVIGESFTPRRPRLARARRNSVQKVSASETPIAMPRTSRRPRSLDAHGDDTALTETMRGLLHIGGVQPIGPVASQTHFVDLHAKSRDLAWTYRQCTGRHQVRLFTRPDQRPGKSRMNGDLQLDGPGPGLPDPVAIAVAVVYAIRRALAVAGAGPALDFQFHQPLGGEADHLAQQIGVELFSRHHVIGHDNPTRIPETAIGQAGTYPQYTTPGGETFAPP